MTFRELTKLTGDFLRVLGDAQKHRSAKSGWVGDEFEWVIYEREVMHRAINAVCLQRGRPLVTIKEVRRVEGMAVGHVDYSQKYAFYCAQLASE